MFMRVIAFNIYTIYFTKKNKKQNKTWKFNDKMLQDKYYNKKKIEILKSVSHRSVYYSENWLIIYV